MTCYLSLAYLTSRQDYSIINRALLKYGFSSFVLLILETLEQLLELEQRAIDLCNPSYNILTTAASSLGFKHTLDPYSKYIIPITHINYWYGLDFLNIHFHPTIDYEGTRQYVEKTSLFDEYNIIEYDLTKAKGIVNNPLAA